MRVLNIRLDQFKTTAYEIARTVLKSRTNLAGDVEKLNAEVSELKRQNEELRQNNRRLQDQTATLHQLQEENVHEPHPHRIDRNPVSDRLDARRLGRADD